jgi:general secretion pathway protein I
VAGFTLIEVLVAFTIATMALVALYRVSSTGLSTGFTAERYSRALLIAESALDTIGIGEPLTPGTSTQRVDVIYDQNITVHARPDLVRPGTGGPAPYPYEVSVSIGWHEGRRDRSIALSMIRLGSPP